MNRLSQLTLTIFKGKLKILNHNTNLLVKFISIGPHVFQVVRTSRVRIRHPTSATEFLLL